MTIKLKDETLIPVILKERQAGDMAKSLNLARECHFYTHF